MLQPAAWIPAPSGGRAADEDEAGFTCHCKEFCAFCQVLLPVFLQMKRKQTSQIAAARRRQQWTSWRKRSSLCWPAFNGVVQQAQHVQRAQHAQQAPRGPPLRAVAVPASAGVRHSRAGEAAAAGRQRAAAGSGPGQQQQRRLIEMHPRRPTGAATSLQVIALNASHGTALQCSGVCASKPPFPLRTVLLPLLPAPQASECAGGQLGGPSAGRHFLCCCPPGSVWRLPWGSSSSSCSNGPAAATAPGASRRTGWRRGVLRWGSSGRRQRAQPWRSGGLVGWQPPARPLACPAAVWRSSRSRGSSR